MAVSLRDTVKISEFIDLSKQDEILPAFMTKVKSVRISTVDKIMAVKNDSLSDVDLLKGVKLVKNGYVCLAGLVVSGEWNLPDNCRGGVSVCIVDKRMKRSKEATLGAYHAPACKKNFSFKLIPNYSITSEDAEKHPWQVLVNIKGVAMEEGYCPLSLEFVSICVVHKNNVRKGLRERILSVTDGSPIELTEKVVEEFVDEVPMAVKLERFRKTKKKVVGDSVNNKKINNSGKKGLKVEEIEDNVSDDESIASSSTF